jgi:hypothetical protein
MNNIKITYFGVFFAGKYFLVLNPLPMRLLLSFIFLWGSITHSFAQVADNENIADEVEKIFLKADYVRLGKLFAPTIHLDLLKYTGQWSSTQSMYIVKEFFDNHPVKSFEVLQFGTNMSNNTFLAGVYKTKSATFDVYIVFKEENGKLYIYKLNIREQ